MYKYLLYKKIDILMIDDIFEYIIDLSFCYRIKSVLRCQCKIVFNKKYTANVFRKLLKSILKSNFFYKYSNTYYRYNY